MGKNESKLLEKILRELQDIKVLLQENLKEETPIEDLQKN